MCFKTNRDEKQPVIRYRPCSDDDFDEAWGQYMKKDSNNYDDKLLKYVQLDATTDNGREEIARLNRVTDDWKNKMNEFNEQTTIQEKCYELLRLVVHKKARPVLCGHIEGWHRTAAMISLMTGKEIDPTTGVLSKDMSFEDLKETMKNSTELMKVDDFRSPKTYAQFLNEKLTPTQEGHHEQCEFVAKKSCVTIRYISVTKDVSSVDSILEQLRKHSKSISDRKLASQKKGADVLIGELISDATSKAKNCIDDDNYFYDPSFKEMSPPQQWQPMKRLKPKALTEQLEEAEAEIEKSKREAAEALAERQGEAKEDVEEFKTESGETSIRDVDIEVEKKAMGFADLLFDEKFVNYCKNPFDDDVIEEMRELWSVPVEGMEDMKLRPPFLNKFTTLTRHPGKSGTKALNTWVANTAYFLPKIIHILFAEKLNKSPSKVGEEKVVVDMCLYAVRYHGNSYGLTNVLVHGMAGKNYKTLPYAAHTNYSSGNIINIIAAALMVCDMYNATLTHPDEFTNNVTGVRHDKSEIEDEIERIKKAMIKSTTETMTAFSSIRVRDSTATVNDIVHALGLFHFRFQCLPMFQEWHLPNLNLLSSWLTAMIYTTALEYSHVVKTLVSSSRTTNSRDSGNKTMLERLIYINTLRELTQVIAHFGLFPVLSNDGATCAPSLKIASDYMTKKEKTMATEFRNLLLHMGVTNIKNHPSKLKCVTNELSRSIKTTTFDPDMFKQSLLPILFLQIIYCLKSSCDEIEDTESSRKKLKLKEGMTLVVAGKYVGTAEIERGMVLDSLVFQYETDEEMKVKKIGSLRVNNKTGHMFKPLTLASICFQVASDHNLARLRGHTTIENNIQKWKEEKKKNDNLSVLVIEPFKTVESVPNTPPSNTKTNQSSLPDESANNNTTKTSKKRKQTQTSNSKNPKKKKKRVSNPSSTTTDHPAYSAETVKAICTMLKFVNDITLTESQQNAWDTIVQDVARDPLRSIVNMSETVSCKDVINHCEAYLDPKPKQNNNASFDESPNELADQPDDYTKETIIAKLKNLKRQFKDAGIDVPNKVSNKLVAENTDYTDKIPAKDMDYSVASPQHKDSFIAFRVNKIGQLKQQMYNKNGKPCNVEWMAALIQEMKKWEDKGWAISLSLMGCVPKDVTYVIVFKWDAYNVIFPNPVSQLDLTSDEE